MGATPLFLDFFFQSSFSIPREQQKTTNTPHLISQISVIFWTDDEAHRKRFHHNVKVKSCFDTFVLPKQCMFYAWCKQLQPQWHKLSTKLHLDLKKESLFYFTAALNLWTCGWKSKLAAVTQDQVKFPATMPIVLEDFLTQ